MLARRHAAPRLSALAFVLLGTFAVSGCGQGDGQVCQIDSDCMSGLTCQCKLGGGSDSRGLCHVPGFTSCMTSTVDAAVRDAATVDANVDAFTPPDMGTPDVGVDVGVDANTVDASTDVGTDTNG